MGQEMALKRRFHIQKVPKCKNKLENALRVRLAA
jgi:hypothetical protein